MANRLIIIIIIIVIVIVIVKLDEALLLPALVPRIFSEYGVQLVAHRAYSLNVASDWSYSLHLLDPSGPRGSPPGGHLHALLLHSLARVEHELLEILCKLVRREVVGVVAIAIAL